MKDIHNRKLSLCNPSGAILSTVKELYRGEFISLDQLDARFAKSEDVAIVTGLDPCIAFSKSGVIVLNSGDTRDRARILASESITLWLPALECQGLAPAGKLSWRLLSWRAGALPSLDGFLQAWERTQGGICIAKTIANATLVTNPNKAIDRAITLPFPQAEFELLACVLSLAPSLTQASNPITIAPIVYDLPEQLQALVAAVRKEPAQTWSLAEASNRAGYSTFHFSRLFKQVVGCGFPEFVDRCRTEVAVELISTGNIAFADVWSQAGFPSSRAMRESIKDYMGLTANELRKLSNTPS